MIGKGSNEREVKEARLEENGNLEERTLMKPERICTGTRGQTPPKVFTQGAIVMIALLVAGCGTTSNFKPTAAQSTVDLSRFDKLNVEDFTDDASQKKSTSKREKKHSEMNRVT